MTTAAIAAPELKLEPRRLFLYRVEVDGTIIGYVRHNMRTWEAFIDLPPIHSPRPHATGLATRDDAVTSLPRP